MIVEMFTFRKCNQLAVTSIWFIIGLHHSTEAVVEDSEVTLVIDYSDLVVFDAFNGSYLSSQDYRGLLLPPDHEPGKNN